MKCPSCGYTESKVVDSRPSDDGSSIRRRRECLECSYRFTTYERIMDSPLLVTKADGSSEAYDRNKLMRGVLIACAKRPVSPEQISNLVNEIESELRITQPTEISSKALGDMVLKRLAGLDEVAYVRFASVYKDFQNIEEFSHALEGLN
ncbi:MAG: transcriptional repressor NrdR [Eggerthellaceae bacterium]|nr:transcriptional repressor NrdR [Eggerthellaceae bacterium]